MNCLNVFTLDSGNIAKRSSCETDVCLNDLRILTVRPKGNVKVGLVKITLRALGNVSQKLQCFCFDSVLQNIATEQSHMEAALGIAPRFQSEILSMFLAEEKPLYFFHRTEFYLK